MLKKTFLSLVMTFGMFSAGYAQENEDDYALDAAVEQPEASAEDDQSAFTKSPFAENSGESGAVAEKSGSSAENIVDPNLAISVHPIAMLIFTGVLDLPSLYVTVENSLGSSFSLITRPTYVGFNSKESDYELDIDLFGLSEGIRYYLGRGHKGAFAAFHASISYLSLDYDYSNPSEDFEVTGLCLGAATYIGYKVIWGSFTSSLDFGVGYSAATVKGDYQDDVESVSGTGISVDMNWTIGFVF